MMGLHEYLYTAFSVQLIGRRYNLDSGVTGVVLLNLLETTATDTCELLHAATCCNVKWNLNGAINSPNWAAVSKKLKDLAQITGENGRIQCKVHRLERSTHHAVCLVEPFFGHRAQRERESERERTTRYRAPRSLLAPRVPDRLISGMVEETNRIATIFSQLRLPILVFLDTHERNKPELPYPEHCVVGTGEENLVPDLAWLENDGNAQLMRKDCINAFIGAFQADGSNVVVDWIRLHQIETLLVVGICTDICVLDFVLTLLSARTHGMLAPLEHVAVYSKACATYDLPLHVAKDVGAIPHPQDLAHHMGLYLASSRGANIVDTLNFEMS